MSRRPRSRARLTAIVATVLVFALSAGTATVTGQVRFIKIKVQR